jgi:hypothetical protein
MTQSIQKQILPNSKASTVSPAQKKKTKQKNYGVGMVAHSCKPSTWEVEAEEC